VFPGLTGARRQMRVGAKRIPMAWKLSGKDRKNLQIILAADGLALLVAVYHQVNRSRGMLWVWVIFGLMLLVTLAFLAGGREEEVIKGLPPGPDAADDLGAGAGPDGRLERHAKSADRKQRS